MLPDCDFDESKSRSKPKRKTTDTQNQPGRKAKSIIVNNLLTRTKSLCNHGPAAGGRIEAQVPTARVVYAGLAPTFNGPKQPIHALRFRSGMGGSFPRCAVKRHAFRLK